MRMLRMLRNVVWYPYFWIKGNLLILYGIWLVWRLPHPRVTFFGGRGVKKDSPYTVAAAHLSSLCAQHGISIITGGGPGIMDAVACSVNGKTRTLGISVSGLERLEAISLCNEHIIFMSSFPARKWLLRQFSQGFIVFPGGLGTLDEFAELLMLMHLGRLVRVPVILFGSGYWKPFLQWLDERAIKEGNVSPTVRQFFTVTDDAQCAFDQLFEGCKRALKK